MLRSVMSRRLCLLVNILVCVYGGFVEPPESFSLRSVAESETRLPCRFDPQEGESVVQVNWNKEQADGNSEVIITAHRTEGTVVGRLATRVRFQSEDPLRDSSLFILNTEMSDEGRYTCQVITFPSGTSQRPISLTVWTIPISLLEPMILEEGQTFRVAALCRSTAHPPPTLSWDTDLPGQSQNRTGEGGRVSSQFALHPLRNMNGRKLDCLVSHPTLERPHRLRNTLVVHFPPNAVISGYDGNWFVGQENVELTCEFGGNPKVENITWTRRGGDLPEDVSAEGSRLVFGRPLVATDAGVYECEARNRMGADKGELQVTVREVRLPEPVVDTFPTIIVAGVAGAIVVIMVIVIIIVIHHHRRKNRMLKRELCERTEEINNISRQTSLRRLNSTSTDLRSQMDDVFVVTKSSISLEECSALRQPPGGVSEQELDSLGRPPIYSSFQHPRDNYSWREKQREESKRRVENYLKNSDHSLDSGLHSSLVPPLTSEAPLLEPESQSHSPSGGTEGEMQPWTSREGVVDGQADGWSPRVRVVDGRTEGWLQRERVAEGVDEDDGATSSVQISEALSNHFHYSNGFLRPKPHPNAIILHPRGQIV
ncbi:nectin-4 isoform X1 [Alosa pseudoharengus]|uniref:nectin-4 isoform X1 n=1 Tax=Alosa pseudoharengus TaxID=34774 RepID=UPI003F8A6593